MIANTETSELSRGHPDALNSFQEARMSSAKQSQLQQAHEKSELARMQQVDTLSTVATLSRLDLMLVRREVDISEEQVVLQSTVF